MSLAPGSFGGRVVAVTGGASGMGAASAELFGSLGATVIIIDNDGEGAHRVATANQLDTPLVGDVGDSAFCTEAINRTVERHGQLDVLVNAAGTIHRADALGTSDEDWHRVMRVNVDGIFFLSRAAIAHMKARSQGAIINFGSIWGGVGASGATAYCTSKGAVHQLTRAMALDHATDGIRINAVAPGEVRTPMLSSQRDTPPSEADLQALADATIPMKRLAEPSEIANVVAFLASDDASYMTGEIVHVDAGCDRPQFVPGDDVRAMADARLGGRRTRNELVRPSQRAANDDGNRRRVLDDVGVGIHGADDDLLADGSRQAHDQTHRHH